MSVSVSSRKPTAQLVTEFVHFRPGKEFDSIKGKLSQYMNQRELETEQLFLTQKLKHVSAYMTRLIDKTYIQQQVVLGKQRG